MFHVYLILNKINGKIYVGKTNNLEIRFATHIRIAYANDDLSYNKFPIHHAIKKYGHENFIFQPASHFLNEQDAFQNEKHWIAALKENNYTLYNLTSGGEGFSSLVFSEEHKRNLSISHKGQIAWNKGISATKETRQKLSSSHLGQKAWNKNIPMKDKLKINISGANNVKASLTQEEVNEIRSLFDKLMLKDIAEKFNVSISTIKRIKYNKTYKIM